MAMIYYQEDSPLVAAIQQVVLLLKTPILMRRGAPPDEHCLVLVPTKRLDELTADVGVSRALAHLRAETGQRAALLVVGGHAVVQHDRCATAIAGVGDLLQLPQYPAGLSLAEFRNVSRAVGN